MPRWISLLRLVEFSTTSAVLPMASKLCGLLHSESPTFSVARFLWSSFPKDHITGCALGRSSSERSASGWLADAFECCRKPLERIPRSEAGLIEDKVRAVHGNLERAAAVGDAVIVQPETEVHAGFVLAYKLRFPPEVCVTVVARVDDGEFASFKAGILHVNAHEEQVREVHHMDRADTCPCAGNSSNPS